MANLFRTQSKPVIIVLGGILVFAFLLPSTGLDHLMTGSNATLGTINGEDVKMEQARRAQGNLATLNTLVVQQRTSDQTGRPVTYSQSLPEAILFGQRDPNEPLGAREQKVITRFFEDPVAYHLLIQEARNAGVLIGASEVETYLADPSIMLQTSNASGQRVLLAPLDESVPEGRRSALRFALAEILSVQKLRDLQTRFDRTSAPSVELKLARLSHTLSLDVIEFKSPSGTDVPQPSDADISEHFAKYQDVLFGTVTDENPFGFGYKTPDLVKLQFIAVPQAAIRESVRQTKTPADWAVDAYVFYQQNPQEFLAPPTTQPTTLATTQPTTQEAEANKNPLPFDAVKDKVVERVIALVVDQQTRQIVERVRNMLRADYDRYQGATLASQPVPGNKFGVDLKSPQYIEKVAQEIQQQFKILPRTFASDKLLSREELSASQDLSGTAIADDLFFNLAPFVSEDLRPSRGDALLNVLQPARAMRIISSDEIIVARVIDAQASRAADDLASVRDRVAADLVRARLLAKAKENAQAFLLKMGEANFASDASFPAFRTSTLDMGSANMTSPVLSRLGEVQFLLNAFEVFASGQTQTGVIEVAAADRVYAAKLVARSSRFPSPDLGEALRLSVRESMDRSLARGIDPLTDNFLFDSLQVEWFDVANIETRLGFVSSNPKK